VQINSLRARLGSENHKYLRLKIKTSRLMKKQRELSQDVAKKEAERVEEEKKRQVAEHKLQGFKEIMEQQKKIAAMYDGLEK
jgi:dephospho-CoA kinase